MNGVPAGSVFCVPDGDAPGSETPGDEVTARLRLLLVEPWARGLGLGSTLVARCLDFAREAGYTDIVLLTYDQLAAARRVYQAAGFTLGQRAPGGGVRPADDEPDLVPSAVDQAAPAVDGTGCRLL